MGNWKRKTDGLILRNLVYLLYGTPSAQNGEEYIFQTGDKKKASITTKGKKEFLEKHFAGYIQLSTVDSMAIADLMGGKTGKKAKGASASIRKDFIDLICRAEQNEEGKTPLETLIQQNLLILNSQIYDKEDFYHKINSFMMKAKDSDETNISINILLELYDYIYYYLNQKNEEGYAIALSWILITALLQDRIEKLMFFCKHPIDRNPPGQEPDHFISERPENSVLGLNDRSFAAKTDLYSLNGRYPQVREIFDGREELLLQIHDFFLDGKRTLFLEGIGGIGKSEVAKQYALKYRKEYDTIIFAPYSSNLKDLICDPDIIRIRHLQQKKNETGEQFFHRKLKILQDITDEKTLIILDNFDVDSDEKLHLFLSGNYRVLVTTRNAHPGYHSLKVKNISEEETLLHIFEKYYGSPIEDSKEREYVKKIIRHVVYHTYTIELIAKQMEASFLSAREMYELLENDSIQNMPRETVEGGFKRRSAFEHICYLFNMSKLNEEQKKILRCMSLMGNSGVLASRFREWIELESFEPINQLIRQSWIRKEADQKISLHPLIISVVHTTDAPDTENCGNFLENIQQFCYHAWDRNMKENTAVTENILSVLIYFRRKEQELPFKLWSSSHFLWQVGKFQESIFYGHLFYESSVKQYGENSMEAGLMANKLGGCYFNTGHLQESSFWYKKGLQIMLDSGAKDNFDLALSYEKTGRSYTWLSEQDFAKAKKYLYLSLEIRQKLLKDFEQKRTIDKPLECPYQYDISIVQRYIATSYLEIGRMYQKMGNFEEALGYTKLSLEQNQVWVQHNTSGIAHCYYDLGVSYYHLGLEKRKSGQEMQAQKLWKQAEQHFQTALKLNLRRRGELSIDCMDNEEYLADTYAALGKQQDARKFYQNAAEIAKKLLGEDSEPYLSICEKIQSAL